MLKLGHSPNIWHAKFSCHMVYIYLYSSHKGARCYIQLHFQCWQKEWQNGVTSVSQTTDRATTAFHSHDFYLILPTHRSAGSNLRYSSPSCVAWRRTPGTPSHCSAISCCCHTTQWPCPALQANIFNNRYLQFNVDSVRWCAHYV